MSLVSEDVRASLVPHLNTTFAGQCIHWVCEDDTYDYWKPNWGLFAGGMVSLLLSSGCFLSKLRRNKVWMLVCSVHVL